MANAETNRPARQSMEQSEGKNLDATVDGGDDLDVPASENIQSREEGGASLQISNEAFDTEFLDKVSRRDEGTVVSLAQPLLANEAPAVDLANFMGGREGDDHNASIFTGYAGVDGKNVHLDGLILQKAARGDRIGGDVISSQPRPSTLSIEFSDKISSEEEEEVVSLVQRALAKRIPAVEIANFINGVRDADYRASILSGYAAADSGKDHGGNSALNTRSCETDSGSLQTGSEVLSIEFSGKISSEEEETVMSLVQQALARGLPAVDVADFINGREDDDYRASVLTDKAPSSTNTDT